MWFLDQFTMWVAFVYGATVMIALESPLFQKVGEKYPELRLKLKQHQTLAFICLWVGALWILQSFWLGNTTESLIGLK